MSVRAESNAIATTPADLGTAIAEAQPEQAHLAEGAAYSTAAPENPLTRNLVVSVRASLNELCLQKNRATWAPSNEALKSICKCGPLPTLHFLLSQAPAASPLQSSSASSPRSRAPRSRWEI